MRKTLIGLSILLTSILMPMSVKSNNHNDFQQNPINYPTDYYSMESLGCLLLQECTEGVVQITSKKDLEEYYGASYNFGKEFDEMLQSLTKIGSNVYIVPEEYFPAGHRGVYHTVSNHFYLNDAFMHRSHTLMSVMRHEAWHAVQDCMAGTIDNNFIAVIMNSDDIPQLWKDIAEKTYPKHVLPWEQEAIWAGKTKGMTVDALKACETGAMWELYPPTPLTKQFLIDKGYIK